MCVYKKCVRVCVCVCVCVCVPVCVSVSVSVCIKIIYETQTEEFAYSRPRFFFPVKFSFEKKEIEKYACFFVLFFDFF